MDIDGAPGADGVLRFAMSLVAENGRTVAYRYNGETVHLTVAVALPLKQVKYRLQRKGGGGDAATGDLAYKDDVQLWFPDNVTLRQLPAGIEDGVKACVEAGKQG